MAAPTAPTLTSITTEALKKAGYASPTSAQLTRAQDEWMAEVKNDIWLRIKNLNLLQTSVIQTLTNGRSRYSMPTDFSNDLTLEILDGNKRGTAQAGSSSSITLAANETATDIVGSEIAITAGTGQNSISRITAYNSTTKVADVSPSWTAPASGSSYMIIDTTHPLIQKPIWELRKSGNMTTRGIPKWYFPVGNADDGEYELYPIPYQSDSHILVCRLTYYIDITELDLSGTLMATLYKRWRNVFTQGVYAKALQDIQDDKTNSEMSIYGGMLALLSAKEQYGQDISNITCTVRDYN
ncbi:MAG: hypothetical protein Q8O68_00910 [Candidatus Daviesbacteria bacterium]|nr:hypothetical protein [Candidatus Daviesbacteria bacterium]